MKIRQALLCLVFLSCYASDAAKVTAINEHCLRVVDSTGVEAGQIVSLSERLAKAEESYVEMRTSVDGRMRALESWRKCEDKKEDEIARRIEQASESAEKCYEKWYGELKASHDRFMVYVNGFLVVITILFAAIGAVVAWWGIVRPSMKLKAIDTEWNGLRIDIDKLKANALSSIEWSRSSKAEQYFQMARLGFAQYKTLKDVNTLEIVVKFLSQSIMHNVGAMNAVGAKSSIAFLNTVMNKHVSEDSDLPKEIEDHRIIVCANLKDWDWGVDVDALKLVFENSEIDDSYASMCVTNFKKVVAKCRK